MKLVYVAGPFSAPDRDGVEANILRAVNLGLEVAAAGAMPVIPHSNTADPRFEKVRGYEFWIEGTADLLLRCDAVIFTALWDRSSGARGEHALAFEKGIPTFYTVEELKAWLKLEAHYGR